MHAVALVLGFGTMAPGSGVDTAMVLGFDGYFLDLHWQAVLV